MGILVLIVDPKTVLLSTHLKEWVLGVVSPMQDICERLKAGVFFWTCTFRLV